MKRKTRPLKTNPPPKSRQTTEEEPIFYRSFLDSSEAIMITNVQGKIVDVNPAFERVYGYTRAESLGQSPRLLRSPQTPPDLYQRMWQDILDPAIGYWNGEIVNRRQDGTRIPVLLSITPIRNASGQITHYMGLAIDLTEKRQLEAKIERQHREYGAFLRHEMRNMLAVVTGYLELAQNHSGEVAPQQKRYLQSAQEAVLATLKTIEALRELEGYELGKIKLEKETVKLTELLNYVIDQLEPLRQKSGALISVQNLIPNDTLHLDPARIKSVFHNLLKNALEHVLGISNPVITVRLYEEDRFQAIAINNGGEPIPPERLKTFFERLNTTKKEWGGIGLGTTYAEVLTRAHGGDVRVTSSAEEGTTVTVRLPRRSK